MVNTISQKRLNLEIENMNQTMAFTKHSDPLKVIRII